MNKGLSLLLAILLVLLALGVLGLLFFAELGAVGPDRLAQEISFVQYAGIFFIIMGFLAYLVHILKRSER